MSNVSPLHPIVFEKFKRAFGELHRFESKDRYWALRPFSYVAAVSVLVNGSIDYPVVWVFDPHDPKDGVNSQCITNETEIDELIKLIEERVRTAGRPRRDGHD